MPIGASCRPHLGQGKVLAMYAISVHQPWAWAILHAGKNVENRSWRTNHRGPLLIHAAKSSRSYVDQRRVDWPGRYGVELPKWEDLVTGALLGLVDVLYCVRPEWVLPETMEVPGLGPCVWASGP